ncbi:MAG: porin family protein [Bacteroidota bacterium]
MKKCIVILGVLLTAGVVSAQTTFQFGPKAGVNISNFSGGTGSIESNTLVGFHVGGFVSFQLGKSFAIQPEVLFSTQGAKYDDASIKNFKANYLNIPVLAQIRMPGGLYLETGPQAGILLTAERDNQTVKELYNSLDWSWAFGLGLRSKMGLGFSARYNLGLTKVEDNITGTGSFEANGKNSVIQLGLFFAIGSH